jgi:(R,R)-butanediol dehydrogenase / meso-butanediol dehydrogenase / diacetyl reductase
MQAAVWSGAGDIALTTIPDPVPAADEAVIRVVWTGLCGSDLEEWREGPVVARPPVVLGHEIVGVVEHAAEDGSGPPAGTRVVVDVVTGCGRCHYCEHGEEGLCDLLVVQGQHTNGGLAEFVLARARRLIPIPDTLPMEHAALAEPLAVAVRAVRKLDPLPGRGVLVIGGGIIGMLVAQLAHAGGAAVVVTEPVAARRALIGSWGIRTAWNPDPGALEQHVRACFAERGPDVVVECSGRPGAGALALRLVAKAGQVVILGVSPAPEPIDLLGVVLGERRLVGSAAHRWDDDVAAGVSLLVDRRVDVSQLVTQRLPLERVADAFHLMSTTPGDVLKILVGPGAD